MILLYDTKHSFHTYNVEAGAFIYVSSIGLVLWFYRLIPLATKHILADKRQNSDTYLNHYKYSLLVHHIKIKKSRYFFMEWTKRFCGWIYT